MTDAALWHRKTANSATCRGNFHLQKTTHLKGFFYGELITFCFGLTFTLCLTVWQRHFLFGSVVIGPFQSRGLRRTNQKSVSHSSRFIASGICSFFLQEPKYHFRKKEKNTVFAVLKYIHSDSRLMLHSVWINLKNKYWEKHKN